METNQGHLTQTRAHQMAQQMLTAAYDAHGSISAMPRAAEAFDFCANAEFEEPGIYPLFADVPATVRMKAMSYYAQRILRYSAA